jgi:DNA polymerase III delta prime subunit
MNIKEILNKDLEVQKIQMSADSTIADKKGRTVVSPLMSSSFLYLICGPSGSGKTNLMISLLKNCKCAKDSKHKKTYYGMFDNVVVVSPSLHTVKNDIFNDMDDSKKFKKLSEDVFETVDSLHEEGKHMLLILDDVSSELKQKEILHDLIVLTKNRRHKGAGLSIIIIGHRISDYPVGIRANASLIMLFKPKTKKEEEFIYEQFINLSKEQYKNLINYVYKSRFDFLLIDTSLRNSNNFQFYRNFNLLEF